jgi:hypothetical protein
MRRIAPLSALATSKFAEIRHCELFPNADSTGSGAANEVDPFHPCGKRMLVCAVGFLFPHLLQDESDAGGRLLD